MAASDSLLRRPAPVDALVIGRASLEEAFEDAVARGRITREDAAELVRELRRRGVPAPAGVTTRSPFRAGRTALPVAGYDELTAAQVAGHLAALTPAQLRHVRDYERRNANRNSVLAAIAALLD
jgi:beta-phosphoglucomutase-like phosphatase (HAD superfamily)